MPEFSEVRLYGALGAKFGRRHRLLVDTPREAIHAMDLRTKGEFGRYLSEKNRHFKVVVGDASQDLDGLNFRNHGKRIAIVPAVQGGKDGFDRILAGIAIMVVSYYTMGAGAPAAMQWGAGASFGYSVGMSCVIGGVAQLIAGVPASLGPQDKEGNKASYLFNGTVNTLAQGNPVPLLYGKLRVGGCVISGGINVQDYTAGLENSSGAIGLDMNIQFGDGTFNHVYNAGGSFVVKVSVNGVAHNLCADHVDDVVSATYKRIIGTNGNIVLADNCTVMGSDGTSWVTCSALRIGDSIFGLGLISNIELVERQYNAVGAEIPLGGVVNISDGGSLNHIDSAIEAAFNDGKCGLYTQSGAIVPCVLCSSSNPNDYPPSQQ